MGTLKLGKMTMRSLFKKPATLMYPVIPREWQERTRGHIDNEIDKCIFCGICQKKCPTNALTVTRADGTWTIERMKCIQCNCCVDVCPTKCLINENMYTLPSSEKIVDTFVGSPPKPKAKPKADEPKENGEKTE